MDAAIEQVNRRAVTPSGEKFNEKKIIFWDGVNAALKITGLVVWLFIFMLALLEVKRYYHIDVIPGYDSAIDDIYGAVRSTISKELN